MSGIARATVHSELHGNRRTCFVPFPLGTKETQWLAELEAWEHGVQILLAEMPAHEFTEHGAIVGGHGEVAAFEELFLFEARPFAVHLAALHRAAYDHHETAVAVVGAG